MIPYVELKFNDTWDSLRKSLRDPNVDSMEFGKRREKLLEKDQEQFDSKDSQILIDDLSQQVLDLLLHKKASLTIGQIIDCLGVQFHALSSSIRRLASKNLVLIENRKGFNGIALYTVVKLKQTVS